jgi:hypothetical protein
MPEWWNGLHGRLKSVCSKEHAGSNPASGTSNEAPGRKHERCGEALHRLGVPWRFSKPTTIWVARRDAVARLDVFVGPKF